MNSKSHPFLCTAVYIYLETVIGQEQHGSQRTDPFNLLVFKLLKYFIFIFIRHRDHADGAWFLHMSLLKKKQKTLYQK